MNKAKSFQISKQEVWESYKIVKANKGAAGVDGITLEAFELNLKGNLFKIWNRMSSGSYFPEAVRRVDIPKGEGKLRPLGIPTVSDRIAQMVVKREMEPELEKIFHENSFGYRPGRSAKDAVALARRNCWKYDWVLDIDIKGFFDNIDHDLLMKAVHKHTKSKWIILYIERWLKAPVQMPDGSLQERPKGTPQGGVISPLLANLFLHYAFDLWMKRNHPGIQFERYADDVICHCESETQAKLLKLSLEERLIICHLELHPEKTKVVYCKDEDRKGNYPISKFDFLGFTFRARNSRNRWGKYFINFSPAVSDKALKKIREAIRSWKLQRCSEKSLEELSGLYNNKIRGWLDYYGTFYKSEMYPTLRYLDMRLSRWAMKKFKRLRRKPGKAMEWLMSVAHKDSKLFAHWNILYANDRTIRAV